MKNLLENTSKLLKLRYFRVVTLESLILFRSDGGWGGIRTHETVARLHAFQACAFDHSATHPRPRRLERRLVFTYRRNRAGSAQDHKGSGINPIDSA